MTKKNKQRLGYFLLSLPFILIIIGGILIGGFLPVAIALGIVAIIVTCVKFGVDLIL
jgi:hypothetical protein